MGLEIVMPQLGESVTEGQIVRWLKRPGEPVARFEPLVEVLTDKVTVEVPSPAEGKLGAIKAHDGETVPVGTVIAVLETAEGAAPVKQEVAGLPAEASAAAPAAPASPERPAGEADGRGLYSPAVRRLAKEYGIDLAQVKGTGEGGRVTREDVLRCVEAANRRPDREAARAPAGAGAVHPAEAPAARPAPPAPAPAAGVAAAPEAMAEAVAPGPVRQVIARRMVESWTTIPHAWTMVEADVTSLVALREQVREAFQQREGFELTYLPFAIKAVVDALQQHPDLNASWGPEGRIVRYRHVNISVAVGLDEALMVPVIREAERLSVTGIARALHDLVGRAKQGRLTADDTVGGTFTVNNTGALGSVLSAPIINPPQGAILTTEAIQRRLVVLKDDQLAIRSIMNLCLSFDHRIVDGVQALRFLNVVKRRLEAFGPGVPLA